MSDISLLRTSKRKFLFTWSLLGMWWDLIKYLFCHPIQVPHHTSIFNKKKHSLKHHCFIIGNSSHSLIIGSIINVELIFSHKQSTKETCTLVVSFIRWKIQRENHQYFSVNNKYCEIKWLVCSCKNYRMSWKKIRQRY